MNQQNSISLFVTIDKVPNTTSINEKKYCLFHKTNTHSTEQCRLRDNNKSTVTTEKLFNKNNFNYSLKNSLAILEVFITINGIKSKAIIDTASTALILIPLV